MDGGRPLVQKPTPSRRFFQFRPADPPPSFCPLRENLEVIRSARVSWTLARLIMEETNSLIEQRKAKLAALRAKGIDPFRNKFTPGETCAHARQNYTESREVSIAGRVTAHRDMGKRLFIDAR